MGALSKGNKGPESTSMEVGQIFTITALISKTKSTKYGEIYTFSTAEAGNKRTTSSVIVGRLTGEGAALPVKVKVIERPSTKSKNNVLDLEEVQ